MQSRIIFRADASATIGTGHVMRCLTLAEQAAELGHEVIFIARAQSEWLQEHLKNANISWYELEDDIPKQENPQTLLQHIAPWAGSWLVMDGYHFDYACQKAVRENGFKLLLIDDYMHLPTYQADILLNQNIKSEKLNYQGEIGLKLLGPGFSLLRPEFLAARSKGLKRNFSSIRNILLTLGGGDMSLALAKIAPQLIQAINNKEFSTCRLHILAGSIKPAFIRKHMASLNIPTGIHTYTDDMPGVMLGADICISAGGSTCWELCCLGLPFLSLEVAENQHNIVQGLDEQNIAKIFSAPNLYDLMINAEKRAFYSQQGLSLVDGHGCLKTIRAMENYV